jgi:DNA-binding XRE family transcriptional regulator
VVQAVMDRPDAVPAFVEHMCTLEERRFGTCNCWRAAQAAQAGTQIETSRAGSEPPPRQADDFRWVLAIRDEQAAQFTAELKRRLEVMPSGQRIRLLRTVLGWTQQQAAVELRISRRTLIRHEQGQHRLPWTRLSLLQRLRQVELDHEQQLFGYLSRV